MHSLEMLIIHIKTYYIVRVIEFQTHLNYQLNAHTYHPQHVCLPHTGPVFNQLHHHFRIKISQIDAPIKTHTHMHFPIRIQSNRPPAASWLQYKITSEVATIYIHMNILPNCCSGAISLVCSVPYDVCVCLLAGRSAAVGFRLAIRDSPCANINANKAPNIYSWDSTVF